MPAKPSFRLSPEVLIFPLLFGLLIWGVYWFELRFDFNFNKYGIYPRTFKGLTGVLCSPFIHGSLKHLYNNTFPLLILSTALFYFYNKVSWKVLLYGTLLSGLLTWVFARNAYHIGASGIIYMLSSFIFFRGIFAKYYRLVAVSLMVVFLYGSLIWYIFPIEKGISWEGHLSGFLTGFLFSFFFKEQANEPTRFEWEQKDYKEDDDLFLKHFDEQGNFVPSSEMEKRQDDKHETSN